MVCRLYLDTKFAYCCCGFTMNTFILSILLIRVSFTNTHWNSYLLGWTLDYSSHYLFVSLVFANMFVFDVWFSNSPLFLNFSSFCPLFFQYLSKLVILLDHYSILLEDCSASINLFQITLFILCLNFSINGYPSKPLPLTALLNSCTNFSIVLLYYSTFFNSATLTDLLSLLLNSCFRLVRKFSTVGNPSCLTLNPPWYFFSYICQSSLYIWQYLLNLFFYWYISHPYSNI